MRCHDTRHGRTRRAGQTQWVYLKRCQAVRSTVRRPAGRARACQRRSVSRSRSRRSPTGSTAWRSHGDPRVEDSTVGAPRWSEPCARPLVAARCSEPRPRRVRSRVRSSRIVAPNNREFAARDLKHVTEVDHLVAVRSPRAPLNLTWRGATSYAATGHTCGSSLLPSPAWILESGAPADLQPH